MQASHSTRRHRRHHRHGTGDGKLVVGLIGLVAAAAAVPFGSVSEWARASVAIAGLAVVVIHLLRPPAPRGDSPPDPQTAAARIHAGASRWLLLSLAVWVATQFLPIPRWAAEVPWLAPHGRGPDDIAAPARTSLAVVNRASAVSAIALWIAYLGIAWAAGNRFGSRTNARLLLGLLASAGVAQAMAGFLRFTPPWLSLNPFAESRFIGTFSSGNSFGGFLSLTLFATVGLACQTTERILPLARNTKLRVLLLSNEHARPVTLAGLLVVAAAIQMAALVLSGSRGAILSALVCLVGLAGWFVRSIARSQHRSRIVWVAALPLLLVLLCAAGAGYSLTLSRFRHVAESPGDSAAARFALWRATVDMVAAHPLGVGPGGYADAFAAFHPPGFKDARAEHAHNDYLELLAELGVPGFALLLALLLLYGRTALRALSSDARSHDPNRWLYRAACAAVLASALHAVTEFNLTARPGVAVCFFTMAGVAIAPAARSLRNGAAGSRGRTAGLLAAATALALVAAWGIPVVRSSLRQAPACDALGFERDDYFWLPAAKPHPARAVQNLNEAAGISRETGRSHYLAAVGAVREFAARKGSAIASNATVYASVDRAGIAQAVGAAMREEELLTLRGAVGKLELAAPAAPLNVDIASAHFRYTARMALLTGDLPLAETTASRVDRIQRMAPNDFLTAERCMAGLLDIAMLLPEMAPPDHTATTRAVDLGLRCLTMVPRQSDRVLVPWADARIAPGIVVGRASDQPVEVLWPLYRYCRTMADPRSAHACLALIERACAPPASGLPQAGSVGAVAPAIPPSSARARNPPLAGADTAWNCLARVVRERCRLSLETGDWLGYRALAAQRAASWAQAADRDDAAARSDDADYLRLRSRRHHTGLTPFQKARLCRHLMNRNLVEEADELLTEVALDASPGSLGALRELLALRTDAARLHGRIFAQARVKRSEGDTRECLRLLDTLSADTPARWFAHRIHLFRAQCMDEMGMTGDPQEAASEALRMCPSDPDAVRMALRMLHGNTPPPHAGHKRIPELLTDSVPPLAIGTRYLGGKVVLDGISVAQDGDPGSWPGWVSVRCTAHWRFFGPVPGDLAVSVVAVDSSRQRVRSSRFALGKTDGSVFSGGYPPYGSSIRTAIVVPAAAMQGGTLALGLLRQSVEKIIPSEEGLDRVSIPISPDLVARARSVGTNAPPVRLCFAPSPASIDQAAITNAWSLSGLPCDPADTRWSASTAGVPAVVRFVLSPTDEASGINLADCHPDAFLLASRGSGIDVTSPSPRGLGRGLARVCETVAGVFLPLPDQRFTLPPGEMSGAIPPLWLLDAPAASWRFMSNLSRDTGSERLLGYGAVPAPNRSPGQPLGSAWRSARGLSDEAMGRRFSHNMAAIFAPSSHWKSHPEWFPQMDGHRPCPTNGDWQVCLSASGVVARAVEAASDFFRANPDRPMYSIGINDSQKWCECGACAALCPAEERSRPARDRWWSEPYWRFANEVACGLEPSWPTKKLGAIAYAAVSPPPSFPLHSNLVVFVCEDAAALFDPAYSRDSERELREWASRARRVGRYGYAGLASWVFPRYCRDQLALDIRRCSAAGVREFYIEDAWLPWVDGPLPYITAELLWDPWRDPRELQRRFCAASFGAAANTMDTYFEALHQAWTNAPQGRWFDGLYDLGAQAARYPPEVRRRLTSLLATARETPGATAVELARVDAVAGPLRFSESVAREHDALSSLTRPPTNRVELAATRRALQNLRRATAERRSVLAASTNEWWHGGLQRTLRSGNTLAKWDARVRNIEVGVSNTVAAIEAACSGDLNQVSQLGQRKESW